MARYFLAAQPQQWELFSWNGPRKQGFLSAIVIPRREIGMLIFQRRTVIAPSIGLSRISFNKPAPRRLVAEKNASAKRCFG
jgi:hypothetical protein